MQSHQFVGSLVIGVSMQHVASIASLRLTWERLWWYISWTIINCILVLNCWMMKSWRSLSLFRQSRVLWTVMYQMIQPKLSEQDSQDKIWALGVTFLPSIHASAFFRVDNNRSWEYKIESIKLNKMWLLFFFFFSSDSIFFEEKIFSEGNEVFEKEPLIIHSFWNTYLIICW